MADDLLGREGDRLARSLRRRSSRDFAQRCLGCTVCACTRTVADIIRPPGAQAGGLRALASARPDRAGKGLLTLSRYEPAMCDDGNPCARRRRARPQGARAGNLGNLRIECRDRGAAVGATARPCRSRIEGRSTSSSARVCAWRSAPAGRAGRIWGMTGRQGRAYSAASSSSCASAPASGARGMRGGAGRPCQVDLFGMRR